MKYNYGLCGLRVASEFPLPELLPWTGAANAEPDLRFRYGAVPNELENADHVAPVFQTKGQDAYLLAIPGSPRFLVKSGSEVCVEPVGDEVDARAILSGTVQGVIYHQRGLFPLHASTVVTGGRAIAIMAPSGTGKSTLAASIAARGNAVIGDDICVIRVESDGTPRVLPTYPRLRLWRDSAEVLDFDPERLPKALSGKEKYLVEESSGFPSEPVVLRDVIVYSREKPRRAPGLERLKGAEAVEAIAKNVHVRRAARALGLQRRLFVLAARVAAHGRVWRLIVPDDLNRLGEAAELVCNLPASEE